MEMDEMSCTGDGKRGKLKLRREGHSKGCDSTETDGGQSYA